MTGLSFEIRRGGALRRQWRFVIISIGNHEIIATSELYKNRVDAVATVELIREHAALAVVVDPTQ